MHALEARFHHFLTDKLTARTATCYDADWNDDGSGQGLVVLEDLIDRGGKFGYSTQHAGIDGVASRLADLAQLHAGPWERPLITPEAPPWLPPPMAVPVDYDQVLIRDHWLGENWKGHTFCGNAPRAKQD